MNYENHKSQITNHKSQIANKLRLRTGQGFTLIELSIVIVIIGLIVAGVVGGQALVEQAKLRSQISQLNKFEVAYHAFKLEYDAIPGDFNRASQYWGVLGGNGNRQLVTNMDQELGVNSESFLFFYHLTLAELVQEEFNNTNLLGSGYPELEISKGKGMTAGARQNGWLAGYQVSNDYNFKAGLNLQVGQPSESTRNWRNDSVGTSSPKNYYTIDKKIDDGIAMEGRFRSYRPPNSLFGNCLDGDNGDYLLSNDQPSCHAYYIIEGL